MFIALNTANLYKSLCNLTAPRYTHFVCTFPNQADLVVTSSPKILTFRTLSSIHTYSTRSASSKKFYVQRTSLVKANQSLKISCAIIWNSLPRHIRDKVLTFSDKTSIKILKLYFLKSRTCLLGQTFLGSFWNFNLPGC